MSPRLGVRFETKGGLRLFTPDGREFQTREDREIELVEELHKTAMAFEEERQRAIDESRRADALAAKLRELGVNPDDVFRPKA